MYRVYGRVWWATEISYKLLINESTNSIELPTHTHTGGVLLPTIAIIHNENAYSSEGSRNKPAQKRTLPAIIDDHGQREKANCVCVYVRVSVRVCVFSGKPNKLLDTKIAEIYLTSA